MADKEEKLTKEEVLQNKISEFAVKNKKLILLAVALVVVAVVAIVVTVTSISNAREQEMIEVAGLQDAFDDLDKESETYAEDFASLIAGCNKLVGGKRYPSVKAQYLIGLAYYKNSDFEVAYDAFMKAYNLNPEIYIAQLALFNAAASVESTGDTDKALELYNKVATDFAEESAVAPRALFNAGRIYQQKGDRALAKTTFEQLCSSYSTSEFAKLAENILNVLY